MAPTSAYDPYPGVLTLGGLSSAVLGAFKRSKAHARGYVREGSLLARDCQVFSSVISITFTFSWHLLSHLLPSLYPCLLLRYLPTTLPALTGTS